MYNYLLVSKRPIDQSGAVAVEAAMTIGIFLLTIFVLATFTIAAFRYVIISDAVSSTLRSLSIDASAGYSNCAGLKSDFNSKARTYISNTYATNGNSNEITFDVVIRRYTSDPNDCRATIQVLGQWQTPPLLRQFVKIGNIEIFQNREIEDITFRKCGNCNGCPT
jgi:hypothetical protein